MLSKKIYFVLSFYFSMHLCLIFGSETKSFVHAYYNQNLFEENIAVHFCVENISYTYIYEKTSYPAYCFNFKNNTFEINRKSIDIFIEGIKDKNKQQYVKDNYKSIFNAETLYMLGLVSTCTKKKDFKVESTNLFNVKQIINASFLAALLKQNDMLYTGNVDTRNLMSLSNELLRQVYLPSIQNLPVVNQDFILPKKQI